MSGVTRHRLLKVSTAVFVVSVFVFVFMVPITLDDDASHGRAKLAATRSDLHNFSLALRLYQRDQGQVPTTDQGLAVLAPNYLEKVPNDWWGSPYRYDAVGTNEWTMYSLGFNRVDENGAGDDILMAEKDYGECYGAPCERWTLDRAVAGTVMAATALSLLGIVAGLAGWAWRRWRGPKA